MIVIKSAKDIEIMKKAGAIAAGARALAGSMVRPGVELRQIDKAVHQFILSHGAKATFLGYGGYPASCCLSVNEVVIHGIPGNQVLKEGDIVSVDVGATFQDFVGDCADTFPCGAVSQEDEALIRDTRQSFWEAFKIMREGYRIGDIGAAVESYCRSRGYGVVWEYTGHGIGRAMHEDPAVPNLGPAGHGARLKPGMTIAVEPMICQGTGDVHRLSDGWTVKTKDGKKSAHYENTVWITRSDPVILTALAEKPIR